MAGERFSLVVANLVAAVLVDLARGWRTTSSRAECCWPASIIAARANEVVEALGAVGLDVTDRRDGGEWVALRLEAPR